MDKLNPQSLAGFIAGGLGLGGGALRRPNGRHPIGSRRCACGCGEKIAANKQFKFGHEQGKPVAEVPDAGA